MELILIFNLNIKNAKSNVTIIEITFQHFHIIDLILKYFNKFFQVQFANWLKNENVLNIYFIVYYSFRVIFVHVGPCISLVILNLLLFRAMRDAQQKRDKLFKENRKSECKKLRDSNCTTLMLIVVVTVFLLTEIPLAVVTVSQLYAN